MAACFLEPTRRSSARQWSDPQESPGESALGHPTTSGETGVRGLQVIPCFGPNILEDY